MEDPPGPRRNSFQDLARATRSVTVLRSKFRRATNTLLDLNNEETEVQFERRASFQRERLQTSREAYRISEAAMYIQDAFDGVDRAHPLDSDTAKLCYAVHLRMQGFLWITICTWTLLTVFEKPLWCLNHPKVQDHDHKFKDACETGHYPTSGLPFVSRWEALGVEIACLFVYTADILLQVVSKGKEYLMRPRNVTACVLAGVSLCDLVYAYATPYSWFRLAPFLRLIVLMNFSTSIRQETALVFSMLPEVFGIGVLVAVYTLLYAWIGTLLFKGSPEGKPPPDGYFHTLSDSLWQLLILITTANFPDVMMPAYNERRVSCLFFISFLLLGLFFLLNVVLAVVFNKYTKAETRAVDSLETSRTRNLKLAFACLDDGSRELHTDTIMALLMELRKFRNVGATRELTDEGARIMVAALDNTGDSRIEEAEFLQICNIIQVRIKRIDTQFGLERLFPNLQNNVHWVRVKTAVNSRWFDYFINAMLLANIFALFIQTRFDLEGDDARAAKESEDGQVDSFWNGIETLFVVLFALEAIFKMGVQGAKKYLSSTANQFDLGVTVLTVAVTIFVYYPNDYNNSKAIQYVACIRLLRSLVLLLSVPIFERVLATFFAMMPAASRLVQFMLCQMYLFSAVGMQMFGGMINKDPASVYSHRLANSTYPSGAGGYYANNFNDMVSGMVMLFELLVVNNWFVLADGFVIATENEYTRVYFVIFYLAGVIICLNIVSSFVLDTFMKEFEREKKVHVIDGEATVENDEAIFDAEMVTGTDTGLQGQYSMTVASHGRNLRRNSLLTELFRKPNGENGGLSGNLSGTTNRKRAENAEATASLLHYINEDAAEDELSD